MNSDVKSQGTKVLKVNWGKNRKIQQETFTSKSGVSREQIRQKAQAMSNTLHKKGWSGIIQVSIVYPNLQDCRNGMWTQAGHNISLMNAYDGDKEPEKFYEYRLYYSRNAPRAGKTDNADGDCLHQCLKEIMGNQCPWEYAGSLKKFLKIDRKEGVDIKYMPKLESRFKSWKINVEGDYIYRSPLKCTQEANLLIMDGHYSIKPCNKLRLHISYNQKVPLLWMKEKDSYKCCDGKQIIGMTKDKFWRHGKDFVNSPYVLVPINRLLKMEEIKNPKYNMIEHHKDFCNKAKILKQKSEGKLNLFKTGTFTNAALNYFDFLSKYKAPEPILLDETKWLQASTMGALMRAEKYQGTLYIYDFVSFYPSIMSNKLQLFPVKRGQEITMTKEEFGVSKLKYGMYRCIITGVNKKLFMYNEDNYYTHFDISNAKLQKGKVELIEDGEPNAWTYERSDLLTGHQLFKPFIDGLFKLKFDKVPYAKEILNCLWGALCETQKFKKDLSPTEGEYNIPENHSVTRVKELKDGTLKLEWVNNETIFKTNYARIKPFLLARGRYIMSQAIAPIINTVKRMHTDSIACTEKITHLTIGNQLNELKYEGVCLKADVINCNTKIIVDKSK